MANCCLSPLSTKYTMLAYLFFYFSTVDVRVDETFEGVPIMRTLWEFDINW